jgi:hypothetical protein
MHEDNRPDLTRWEYKLVQMGNPLESGVQERADAFGNQCWELVAIDAGVWVFKRPRAHGTEPTEPLRALVEQTVPLIEDVGQATPGTPAGAVISEAN